MTRITTEHLVDDDGLAALRRSRTDLVTERREGAPDGADQDANGEVLTFVAEAGPFDRYRRTVRTERTDPGRHTVTETTEFRLAIPLWWPLLTPLMRRALRSAEREPRARWWWPKDVVPATTSRLVGAICVVSVMTGYLGVVISQTLTFAAEDFGNSDSAQANTLAAVRIGVLLSLVFLRRADRYGRRPLVLNFATAAVAFTVIGSLAPNLWFLGGAQTIARGLTTGLITLLFLAASEEVPATARAFTISLVTIAAALGAGMVVWVLPVADLIEGGWRVVYMVPVLFVPVVWWVGRHLPETRRFRLASEAETPAPVNRARLALLGGAAFATAWFASPASQLRNEFLRDDLGFSAGAISLFQLVISAPAGTAIVIAGIAADRMGRRWIAALGISIGATMTAVSYLIGGPGLWVTASLGVVLGGAAFPAMRGYQTELFPTRARAKVGGILDVVAVAGSAGGLVTVGYLADRWDNLSLAIASMLFAPLITAALVIFLFPETARRELEAFNPGDPSPDNRATR